MREQSIPAPPLLTPRNHPREEARAGDDSANVFNNFDSDHFAVYWPRATFLKRLLLASSAWFTMVRKLGLLDW